MAASALIWQARVNSTIRKPDFRVLLKELGVGCTDSEADVVFDVWDEDKSGTIELSELKKQKGARCLRDALRSAKSSPPGRGARRHAPPPAALAEAAEGGEGGAHDAADRRGVDKQSTNARVGAADGRCSNSAGASVTWASAKPLKASVSPAKSTSPTKSPTKSPPKKGARSTKRKAT